jgi:exopolyphosphatase / guanosine-5'-triphosphate,3'-diphosphate pyrophosphatase
MAECVAVIDVGSNSIKVLVAQKEADGQLTALKMKTLEARISAGISQSEPRLGAEGMQRGVDAIKDLLNTASAFSPSKVVLVATSAVRDALNGKDFVARVESETGHRIRILSGDEEANLIGRGLTCDPALRGLREFYLFDLGGGSLECLSFRQRRISQAISLPLGCVRLTERWVKDPAAPFPEEAHRAVADFTMHTLRESGFRFELPPEATAIGTGGTLTTARMILGARRGQSPEETDSLITVAELRELLTYVGRANLEDRRRLPGMPPGRADVMPTAIATMIAVADLGGIHAYRNSLYNLRWGLADELLSGPAS